MGMFPSSFCFALQYAHLTTFAMDLGVSAAFSSLIWLCGPVTGMLVQPLIGQLSDRYNSPLGKRRPFIIMGGCFLIVSEILVAYVTDIGYVIGDRNRSHNRAICLFVFAFWVFDAANNTLAISLRALLSDLLKDDELQRGFSLQQVWSSIGYVCGYFAAQLDWASIIPYGVGNFSVVCQQKCVLGEVSCPEEYIPGCMDLRFAFLTSALITAGVIIIVCAIARESTYVEVSEEPVRPPSPFKRPLFLSDLPIDFRVIYTASLLSWFGWFSALIYQVHFVAVEVAAHSKRSEHFAFVGLMTGSVLSGIVSTLLPFLTTGEKGAYRIWGFSCFLLSGILGCSPLVASSQSIWVGTIWLTLFGGVYAVSNSVPFSLIAHLVKENGSQKTRNFQVLPPSAGRLLGLLNVAVCIPQVLTALFGGAINSRFSSDIPCFLIGALFASLAGALLIRTSKEKRRNFQVLPSEEPVPQLIGLKHNL